MATTRELDAIEDRLVKEFEVSSEAHKKVAAKLDNFRAARYRGFGDIEAILTEADKTRITDELLKG